ncbi:MAG: SRPBCC domain-containing protein [Deltaproteobacteria bacterium]
MNPLHFDIYIAAPPKAVWEALTQPEGVAKLYFGSRLETTFEAGSPYRYVGPDGKGGEVAHVEGEILDCKPGELLQLTHRAGAVWQKGPKVYRSRLAYRIQELGFATKLSVVHDGWEEGDPGHAHNSEGWPLFLSSVKSYLETGKPLPLPMF